MKTTRETPMMRCWGMALLTASALFLPSCTSLPDGFAKADTDGDGKVSPPEFERYMLESIYLTYDADGDSKVTWKESLAANPSAEKSDFIKADADGDGVITPAEAKAAFKSANTMGELFGQIDTDGNGSLDRAEVEAFMAKMEAQSGSTPMEKLSQAAN